MSEDISINKAVLHILDHNISVPVLSGRELEIDGEMEEFLKKHLDKILNDSGIKNARFIEENNRLYSLCSYLKNDESSFMSITLEVANFLFEIMQRNVDILPADLIVCVFALYGKQHLAILKLNYKSCYTHFVNQEEDGNTNTIIKHRTLLPSDGQRIDEAAIICLEDMNIKMVEKEYEINGSKEFYFSKLFLGCSTDLSGKEKLKIIEKAAQKINKKYFDEDFDKVARLKKRASESLEENNTIEVEALAEEVYENNVEIRNEYIAEIEKAGLIEKAVPIPEKLIERKFRTHKIKTDNGIEINFPLSYYEDSDKIEFINNPDGTISIIIKNVGRIINK